MTWGLLSKLGQPVKHSLWHTLQGVRNWSRFMYRWRCRLAVSWLNLCSVCSRKRSLDWACSPWPFWDHLDGSWPTWRTTRRKNNVDILTVSYLVHPCLPVFVDNLGPSLLRSAAEKSMEQVLHSLFYLSEFHSTSQIETTVSKHRLLIHWNLHCRSSLFNSMLQD